MFLDEVKITVIGGKGGNGITSFRREKYVPRGGPDGGDGGRGGHVIFKVDEGLNTLSSFRNRKVFKAQPGGSGSGGNRTGKDGEDLIIPVPPGTVVFNAEQGTILADLTEDGEEFIAARGGRGGRGNARFASSTKQVPRHSELGAPGAEKQLRLELKLLAEVGLVGLPNAGKSTLLSRVSNSQPKIADYPFTTLAPFLGVVDWKDKSMVWADLPGLIEGAHKGVGLGHQFLRHVERTRVLLCVLDGSGFSGEEPLDAFKQVREELKNYRKDLSKRPALVAVNKSDLPETRERWPGVKENLEKQGFKVVAISAATGAGIEELCEKVYTELQSAPQPKLEKPLETKKILKEESPFSIKKEGEVYVVFGGEAEKKIATTNFENEESVRNLLSFLQKKGLYEALKKKGIQEGDTVQIGPMEFDYIE